MSFSLLSFLHSLSVFFSLQFNCSGTTLACMSVTHPQQCTVARQTHTQATHASELRTGAVRILHKGDGLSLVGRSTIPANPATDSNSCGCNSSLQLISRKAIRRQAIRAYSLLRSAADWHINICGKDWLTEVEAAVNKMGMQVECMGLKKSETTDVMDPRNGGQIGCLNCKTSGHFARGLHLPGRSVGTKHNHNGDSSQGMGGGFG